MKRNARNYLAGWLAAFATVANAGVDEIRAVLAQTAPHLSIGEIRKLPFGELYEVQADGINIFYTDATGSVALMGNLIALRTGENLSETRKQELSRVDWAKLPLDKAIVKVKGKGERKVALFSDPDCPYCQQLERELMDVDNVTIYIFLYPLTTIHPDAERKARLVWCAPDRARAWDELMLLKREPAGPADCATPFKEIAEFADKSWILGTPGIVFSSGQLVPGAINRQQFEQLL